MDTAAFEVLRRYEGLLRAIAVPRGMIASSDADKLWDRHVMDGFRGVELIGEEARRLADLGSGAGIPGIPIAAGRPDLATTLCEPRRDRAAFLEMAAGELALSNVAVHVGRAQTLPAASFDVCCARAFRGPSQSWEIAKELLGPDGVLLYWAGREGRVPDVPGAEVQMTSTSSLADAGPIAMMTRR